MADAAPLPPLLKIPEVAAILNVTERTVYRRIADNELPTVRIGRNRRIRQTDLEAFISAGATDTADVA